MSEFLNLRRKEKFPEKALMKGIRVLDIRWLHSSHLSGISLTTRSKPSNGHQQRNRQKLSRSDHEAATTLIRNVLRWLYTQFLIPLLRSAFYITETEFTGSRVLYYRKPVWMQIKYLSMKILLKRQYRELTLSRALKLLSSHNVGCSPAPFRILPKKTGIRAIAMLSKSCAPKGELQRLSTDTKSPNMILQPTFHALKYEHKRKPSLFGAGVLGLTDVFPPFCLFLEALREKQANGSHTSIRRSPGGGRNGPFSLYFTSADIQHCYDTINQKRLHKLIRSTLKEDYYLTQNHFILHSTHINGSPQLRIRWKKSTYTSELFSQFLLTSKDALGNRTNSIFVDGVSCFIENKANILGRLRDHIFGQVVVANGNFGPQYLLQKNGIPQVRYCGRINNHHLNFVEYFYVVFVMAVALTCFQSTSSLLGKHFVIIILQHILWQC